MKFFLKLYSYLNDKNAEISLKISDNSFPLSIRFRTDFFSFPTLLAKNNLMIQRVFKWTTTCLRNIITRPREELDRWQRAARFFYDLARYGAQQLRHDRASQMAGALAFRSLFALLPVFIVGMIVIKAVRGTDSFLDLAQQLFTSLNLDDVRVFLVWDPPWSMEMMSAAARIQLGM